MPNKQMTKRRILYLALALLISVSIWFYVDELQDRKVSVTVEGIPIEYTGVDSLTDKGLMLVDGEESATDHTIDLTLEGVRRLVVQLDRTKIRVMADLSKIHTAGTQTVSYMTSFTDRKFTSATVTTKDASVYAATVEIHELSRKDIEVRCELIGTVLEGFTAGKVSLSKDMIEVRGQTDEIEAVSYAKVTLNIGSDAKETVSEWLKCSFYDAQDRLLTDTALYTEDEEIKATLPIYVTKELNLVVDFVESPGARLKDVVWRISPETIVVSGDASVLNGMRSIHLDSFDLLNASVTSTTHSYSILVPDGCENLSGVTRAALEIAYPTRSSAQMSVPLTQVRFENAPEGKTVFAAAEALDVRIFGTEETVSAVLPEDIAVVADLSDYGSVMGTYTIPVTLELGTQADIGFSGMYEIPVTIRDESFAEEPEEAGEDYDTNSDG